MLEDRVQPARVFKQIERTLGHQCIGGPIEQRNRAMIGRVAREVNQPIRLVGMGPKCGGPTLRNRMGAIANAAVGMS